MILDSHPRFNFFVQEFKRGKWNDIACFEDLSLADEFAKQRALRTLERTRLVRVDVTPLIFYHYAR